MEKPPDSAIHDKVKVLAEYKQTFRAERGKGSNKTGSSGPG
jgi:hypothetical protein